MIEDLRLVVEPRTLLVYQRQSPNDDAEVLEEIGLLARSAGAQVVDTITAFRRGPDSSTFIGSGKLQEIKEIVDSLEIELVVINHSITPIQERNLERELKVRVLDRTGLILDIFAQRAQTHEGKLQVELAQLQHLSTRLVRGWTHLERQKGGIGLRGPGETQLETDRRLIGHRIKALNKRLETVSSQRQLRRKSRAKVPVPTVSLVGYTNAGKSSLFNRLTNAGIYVQDQLFATLDTTMRRIELDNYGEFILSDTVGFIRDLPHSLVKAFHSTLEEVASANLLIHLVDVASVSKEQCINEVDKVLREIEASDIDTLLVFNKIDLVDKKATVQLGEQGLIERVWLSAHSGEGIEYLLEAIAQRLARLHLQKEITLQPQHAKLRAVLYQKNMVQTERMLKSGAFTLQLQMSPADYGWLQKHIAEHHHEVLLN